MRHSGMQHNSRMRELADKITWANLEAMADKGDVVRLKQQIAAAQKKADASGQVAEALQAFQNKLITDIRYNGVTDWGLPGSISLTEWERVVGKPSDSFYWNEHRDKFERPAPETAPVTEPQTQRDAKTK